MIQIPRMWLGTESALVALLQKMQEDRHPPENWFASRLRGLAQARQLYAGDEEGEEPPIEEEMAEELIERYDSVGVVSVTGHLVNAESPILSWFGATGYPTIARAVNRLLEDEEIASIVLSLSTAGGEADGISDLGDSIREADKVKPVYAWTGSHALSAGYWIAASARNAYSSKMGQTGSIGAVATIKVIHRMLEENGIDVHVARSVPRKALPSPYEPLTEEGKKKMQKEVDTLHGFFVDYIASQRPALSAANSEGWANGDTFFGEEALSLGLVDAPLQSINSLISELDEAHNRQSDGDSTMPKHVVLRSETDRVRMAAGLAVAEGVEQSTIESVPTGGGERPAVESAAPQREDSSTDRSERVSLQTKRETSPQAEREPSSSGAANSPVEAFLREREQELRTELGELRNQVVELTAKLEAVKGQVEQLELLREPMRLAVERLQVALGHRPMSLKDMPPNLLANAYTELYNELMAMPVGRQSVPAESQPEGERAEGEAISPLAAARLSVVRNER